MSKRKRLIPFSWRNILLGLEGKSYDRTKAEYELSGEELERALAEIDIIDSVDMNIKILELDLKYKKITQTEFEKKKATILKEPWVSVIDSGFAKDNPSNGFFEVDWNDEFISHLEEHGYTGVTSEDMINSWLNDVCKNILYESGVLDLGAPKEEEDDSKPREDGKKEYT